jgi:hypothetical protein
VNPRELFNRYLAAKQDQAFQRFMRKVLETPRPDFYRGPGK